jgi:hypothetical protein
MTALHHCRYWMLVRQSLVMAVWNGWLGESR